MSFVGGCYSTIDTSMIQVSRVTYLSDPFRGHFCIVIGTTQTKTWARNSTCEEWVSIARVSTPCPLRLQDVLSCICMQCLLQCELRCVVQCVVQCATTGYLPLSSTSPGRLVLSFVWSVCCSVCCSVCMLQCVVQYESITTDTPDRFDSRSCSIFS